MLPLQRCRFSWHLDTNRPESEVYWNDRVSGTTLTACSHEMYEYIFAQSADDFSSSSNSVEVLLIDFHVSMV